MASLFPGVAVACAIALVSNLIHNTIVIGGQKPVSAVVLAIVFGMAIRAFYGSDRSLVPGLTFSVKKILRFAIILLGFDFQLSALFGTGVGTSGVILVAVVTGILSGIYLGKALGLREELSLLIGTGTAICGATAIVATAPAVGADDSDVSYAVGTITLFGVLAIFAYPALGRVFGLSDQQFGVWTGTAVHETAQVLAAGFAWSDTAGKTAALVKLTRTVLLAPLVLICGMAYARKCSGKVGIKEALACFPYFILWFIGASLVRTLVGNTTLASLPVWKAFLAQAKDASKFLIVVAMASTGMMTDFTKVKKVGLKPFVSGLIASLVVGGVTLFLVRF